MATLTKGLHKSLKREVKMKITTKTLRHKKIFMNFIHRSRQNNNKDNRNKQTRKRIASTVTRIFMELRTNHVSILSIANRKLSKIMKTQIVRIRKIKTHKSIIITKKT